MRGRDFLTVVSFLDSLDGDASVRTRVGRLYYAAFLEARSWCELRLGYERTRTGRDHADLSRLLAAREPDIADNLRFLRALRNTADYELSISPETIEGQRAQAEIRASRIIARLDELAADDGTGSESEEAAAELERSPAGDDEPGS